MKSELLTSQRTKVEGRQGAQMRKMSKSTPVLENGPNPTPSASSVPKNDGVQTSSSSDNSPQKTGDKMIDTAKPFESIDKLTADNIGDSLQQILKQKKPGNQESAHLKEMLILHLGMIQHQQQLLLAKDRLIRTLAAEKDALKCRLDRMERRMSLLKQKGEGMDSPLPSDLPASLLAQNSPEQRTPEKAIRRKHTEQRTPNRRILTPNRDQSQSGKIRTKSRHSLQHNRFKIKKKHDFEDQRPSTPSRDIELRSKQTEPTPVKAEKYDPRPASVPTRQEFRLKPVKRKIDEIHEVLRTEENFYVPVNDFKETNVVAKVVPSPAAKKKRSKVEVPKWRFHPVSNCYALEGTENLEDEIFSKRHQKPENEEKRRKRWDIQRIREQRMYEKLKCGRYASANPPKAKNCKKDEIHVVTSFTPVLDEAKFIEIAVDIPVNVFGYPLTAIPNNEFSLPWFDISKRDREEKQKPTRGRKR